MEFYDEWEKCARDSLNDDYYINSFLYQSIHSVRPLVNSSQQRIQKIIQFLINYDNSKIIDKINYQFIKILSSSDVAQFSDLDKATKDITHLLKYERNGLTFEELGYLLVSSPNKLAATKYGENQAKTAKIFSLVYFSDDRPTVVKNTSIGNFFPLMDNESQKKLLSILCLRDPVIQCFVAKAKSSRISYNNEVCCLSPSTSYRRRNNIQMLVSLALYGTSEINILNNIEF